ncbi:MAG TPA: DUF4349 domain-containing protein [Solirubrobacterales bacterium]|nr:DUF4349 domain-containing protein [Solirubrobacterales bacterium]
MEPFDDKLSAELSALRPTPDPAFAAELDQRAAAGFPRRSPKRRNPFSAALTWLWRQPRKRLAFSAAGAALAAVAVAVVMVGTRSTETVSYSSNVHSEIVPLPDGAASPSAATQEQAAGGYLPRQAGPADTGPFAAKTDDRDVERSAEIVLGADPADVGKDAAEVFDAVHAVDGIVLRSSVRGGAEGDAGAEFELLIPSAKLGDALAAFSAIDSVVSRHEATDDITAPTVRTGELLRDSRAKIDGLLVQLAEADTEAERVAAETELRAERRRNANLRSQLSSLERRANLSRVSLRIETGAGAGSDESGAWGVGDAFDDAGRILGIAAGVSVIALAVLAPFALVALLAWLGNRARLRRARERALA